MITQAAIDELLRKVQAEPEERLLAYNVCFENLLPGESPDNHWIGVKESEASTMRAAIRLGFLSESSASWQPEFPEEYAPDGRDYFIALTGLGTGRLISLSEPFGRKAIRQVLTNLPTIVVSVLTSLAVSWVVYYLGAPKP